MKNIIPVLLLLFIISFSSCKKATDDINLNNPLADTNWKAKYHGDFFINQNSSQFSGYPDEDAFETELIKHMFAYVPNSNSNPGDLYYYSTVPANQGFKSLFFWKPEFSEELKFHPYPHPDSTRAKLDISKTVNDIYNMTEYCEAPTDYYNYDSLKINSGWKIALDINRPNELFIYGFVSGPLFGISSGFFKVYELSNSDPSPCPSNSVDPLPNADFLIDTWDVIATYDNDTVGESKFIIESAIQFDSHYDPTYYNLSGKLTEEVGGQVVEYTIESVSSFNALTNEIVLISSSDDYSEIVFHGYYDSSDGKIKGSDSDASITFDSVNAGNFFATK